MAGYALHLRLLSYRGWRRLTRPTVPASIRRQRDLVVDQRVQRRLDVALGVDDAGLLQREARGKDRLALRGAEAAVGEFGALFQLLVDDFARQLGDADERLLQVVVIRQRIFSRFLIHSEHAADGVGMIL